jgi:hypothetical protein
MILMRLTGTFALAAAVAVVLATDMPQMVWAESHAQADPGHPATVSPGHHGTESTMANDPMAEADPEHEAKPHAAGTGHSDAHEAHGAHGAHGEAEGHKPAH